MEEFASMTNVDGVITRTADARVPVMDRGFLYGDSVYEVFRTYGGNPLFYDEHWARFENSARLIHLGLGLTKAQMTDEIRQTIRMSNAPAANRDVYVRYTVTRGIGPVDLFPDPELVTRYVIIVKELQDWNPDFYRDGVRLAVPQTRRNPTSALDPNIKGGNYLNNVLGVIEARALGADDCVMLDDAGLITEASNSNVFFVLDGDLITPGASAGHLRGLTKAAVEEACVAHGLPTHARKYHGGGSHQDFRMFRHQRHARDHARAEPALAKRAHARVSAGRRCGDEKGHELLPGLRGHVSARSRAPVLVLKCAGPALPLYSCHPMAPVVQLDRTPAYEAGSREFESLRARHFSKGVFQSHGLGVRSFCVWWPVCCWSQVVLIGPQRVTTRPDRHRRYRSRKRQNAAPNPAAGRWLPDVRFHL